MQKVTFSFSFNDLNIGIPQIGKLIDYDRGENQEMIAEMVGEVLREAGKICDIRGEYVIYDDVTAGDDPGKLIVHGTEFSVGKIVRGQLKRSRSVAVFLCTAGAGIGEKARNLISEKDFLRGYIFDITGSEIAEAAADRIQENLRENMEAINLHITNRYSPGYCGWHVSEQHKLFSLVPDNYCGIALNESALMEPVKSVSGFIGIGEQVKFNPYSCNLCDIENCIYRKHKGI
jgi:hypothetical protein